MRHVVVGSVVVLVLAVAGCSSGGSDRDGASGPTTTKEPAAASSTTTTEALAPLEDQAAPSSINGLEVQGDTIWVASIEDDAILQVDRESGAILRRIDAEGAGPDDVAVAPDGSVWSTGFQNGDIGHIVDGEYSVATTIEAGINPLAFGPDGQLYLGTIGPDGSLFRIDPEHPEMVVSLGAGMPGINAFGVLDDGTIVAPAGSLTTPGSAVAIEVLSPCQEGKGCTRLTTVAGDLPGVAAGTVDADGNAYVLANATGEVIRVDVDAKTSKVVRTVEHGAPFDNLAFAEDGTLYLSSFTSPTITEVRADGTERTITIGS
jgi:sugar lactone lactonase YvrE